MKNQYIIVKSSGSEEELFYNEDYNIFSTKHATIYKNKRTATNKRRYAEKYATGSELPGEVIVKGV